MRYIGKLNKALYRCVTEDITTDEVIITEERIQHIKDHHPGHFELIAPHLKEAIESPDYILKDAPRTGLVLKRVWEQELQIRIVLRLHTAEDPAGFQNSVLSAWKIREKEYERLIRNKTVLYKREYFC